MKYPQIEKGYAISVFSLVPDHTITQNAITGIFITLHVYMMFSKLKGVT